MARRARSGKISIQSLSRGQDVQTRSVPKSNHEIWAFPEGCDGHVGRCESHAEAVGHWGFKDNNLGSTTHPGH